MCVKKYNFYKKPYHYKGFEYSFLLKKWIIFMCFWKFIKYSIILSIGSWKIYNAYIFKLKSKIFEFLF